MILRYLASIYTNYAAKSPKSRGRICTFGDVLTCSKDGRPYPDSTTNNSTDSAVKLLYSPQCSACCASAGALSLLC